MWFKRTYKLPSIHEAFQNVTLQEHLVDYYEHLFQEKPIEMHRQGDGEIQFTNTGDYYIDKWEQELADGQVPDLKEVFSPEEMAKLKRARAHFKSGQGSTFKEVMERIAKENASIGIDHTNPDKPVRRRTFG